MTSRLMSLLRNLFRHRSVEQSLDSEVRTYLDMLTDEKVAAGLPPDAARRAALVELGGVEQVKEEVREARAGALVEQMLQDVRYGIRMLRRSTGFTFVAVVTLGLAMAANTAMFTVFNAVLLRPLPYTAPERLVAISGLSYLGDFLELRQRARTLEVGAYITRQVALTGTGEPVRLRAAVLSADAWHVLGVQAAAGRTFEPGEDRTGSAPVAVISDAAWRRRFGADQSLVGGTLRIDGVERRVVGIMPADVRFPNAATDVWIPLTIDPANRVALWSTSVRMIGRIRPGASIDHAAAELRALGPTMRPLFPWKMPDDYGAAAAVVPLHQSMVGDVDSMLFILLAAVTVLLLIACVNVSNLFIGRALTRRRELAVRSALGAGTGRIVRQLLTESALIGTTGGLLGVVLAAAAMSGLVALLPIEVPRVTDIAIDIRVLAFTAVVALGSGILIGAVPAWRASRNMQSSLAEGARTGAGRRSRWMASSLVAAEIALAVLLVISAALLTRSFANLVRVEPGFQPNNLMSAVVAAPEFRYRGAPARREFYRNLLERVEATPGTQAAALGDRLPFTSQRWGSVFIIEGRPNPATEGGEWPWADVRAAVSDRYFETMAIPVRAGRAFTAADGPTAQRAVVVSEALARRYWPGEDALGRRLAFPGAEDWWTIVGIVSDLVWERPGEERKGALYLPMSQTTPGTMSVVVRTTRDPAAVAADLRRIVASLDRDTPIDDIRTMDQRIVDSVERPRFAMMLLGAFASVGLLLGAIGVYGSVSELVVQRRREIGVRMALGARPRDVLHAVMRHALLLVGAGLALGVAGAAGATRGLSTLLYGVTATDPLTFILVPVALGAVALLASYLPALRATRVDPLIVLRHD